jgi:hypothetical protein
MKFINNLFLFLFFVLANQIKAQIVTQPSNVTICGNKTVNFKTKHTYTAIKSQNWQVKSTSGSKWINLSSIGCYSNTSTDSLIINNAPDTINNYEYRFFITRSGGNDSSQSAKLTINTVPISPTTSSSNISLCKNAASITLTANNSTGCSLNWYTTSTGGTSSSAAPTVATTTVGTTKYYVSQTNNTTKCESSRLEISVTINDLPTKPTVISNFINYCQNQSSTQLSATSSSNCSLYWYNSLTATGGTSTAPTPSTATVGSTIYYVGQTNNTTACESSRNDITVTIDALPGISSSSSNSTICEGGNTNFTISASGTNISYQWQVDNGSGTYTNISTAGSNPSYSNFNTATLSLSSIPSSCNNFQYRCLVTGKCSPSVYSTPSKLTVNTAPVISSNTSNSTICENNSTSFSVTATGTSLQYQWQVNTGSGFTNISSAGTNPVYQNFTSGTLNVNSVIASNNNFVYRCNISGTCSPSVTSGTATLTVFTAPKITSQPSSIITCEGTTNYFEAVANGSNLTYQWQVNKGKGWADIQSTGSNPAYYNYQTSKLTVDNPVQWNDGYQYRCIINGSCTPSVTTNSVLLSVDSKPTITSNANNTDACFGSTVVFFISATGTRLNYLWQVASVTGSWINIDSTPPFSNYKNHRSSQLTVNESKVNSKFRAIVSNAGCLSATTNETKLKVNNLPNVNAGNDVDICYGSNGQLSATITSNYKSIKWSPTTGIDNIQIINPIVSTSIETTYEIVVIDSNNCANSDQVKVNIVALPKYSTTIDRSEICQLDSSKLVITTTDGIDWTPKQNIKQLTAGTFYIYPKTTTNYNFVITNKKGCQSTFSSDIKVNNLPNTVAGKSTAICIGNKLQLDASGAQFYKWKKDSTLNSTNISNPIANPMRTQQYFVMGTTTFGCSKWDSIKVTVNPLPIINLLSNPSSCINIPNDIEISTNANKISWNADSGLTKLNTASPTFVGKRNTTLTVTVTDSNACRQSKSFEYIVFPLPKLELSTSNATICGGQNTTITAQGAVSYTWTGPFFIQDQFKGTTLITPKSTSFYYVTGINSNKCQRTDSIQIKVISNPNPKIIGDTFVCKNQNWATFSITNNNPDNTIRWKAVNGDLQSGEISENVSIRWGKTAIGAISATETMNVFPYCYTTTSRTVNMGKGQAQNPTIIFAKGNTIKSNILIADNKTYYIYQWGFEDKKTNVRTIIGKNQTWCAFDNIDTVKYRYFVLTNTDINNICPNITYFNTPHYSNTDLVENINIQLFPNPVDKYLTIGGLSEELKTIQIIDEVGKSYPYEVVNNAVDISALAQGIYFLQLTTKNQDIRAKFIVQR